jgi:hypothetical protein
MAQRVFERMEARARREAQRETLQQAVQQVILARFPTAPEGCWIGWSTSGT